jgi:hypothetical protein
VNKLMSWGCQEFTWDEGDTRHGDAVRRRHGHVTSAVSFHFGKLVAESPQTIWGAGRYDVLKLYVPDRRQRGHPVKRPVALASTAFASQGESSVSRDNDRAKIQEALIQTIIRVGAEGTTLDEEDREVLKRYGIRQISYDQMMSFFKQKAARIQSQIDKPQ